MKFFRFQALWAWLMLCALSTSLSGCGGGGGGPGAPTLTGVKLQPADSSIAAGTRQQFQLVGTYSDGSSQDLTASASWASSSTDVATISNTAPTKGLASGLVSGTTQITASGGGQSVSTTLKVLGATVQAISVTPASASVAKGLSYSFQAIATLSNGATQDVTVSCSWSSSDSSIATIDASSGLAIGTGIGSASITASLSGLKSSSQLTVGAAVVQSLLINPATASVPKGSAQSFTATAQYSDGSTADVTSAAGWSSANTSIASINSAGAASAVAVGTAKISSSYGGVSSSADFSVTPAAVVSLAVSPPAASITKGATQQLRAMASYTDGSTQDLTSSATWVSSDAAVASVSAQGLATALAVGSVTISATTSGATASMQFTTLAPTLSSLSLSPQNPVVGTESTQAFTLQANFSDGSKQDVTQQASWSNSNAYAMSLSAQGVAAPVAAGISTISVQYGGLRAETSATVGAKSYIPYVAMPANTYGASGTLGVFVSDQLSGSPLSVDMSTWRSIGELLVPFVDESGTILKRQPHSAFYVAGPSGDIHFYRLPLDASRTPEPLQLGSARFASIGELCAVDVLQMDEKRATAAVLLYATPGSDGSCDTADDEVYSVNYGDAAGTSPQAIQFPAHALYSGQYYTFFDDEGLVSGFVALDISGTVWWSDSYAFANPQRLLDGIDSISLKSRNAMRMLLAFETPATPPQVVKSQLYRISADGKLSASLFDYGATKPGGGITYQDNFYFSSVEQTCFACQGKPATLRIMTMPGDGSAAAQVIAAIPQDGSQIDGRTGLPSASSGIRGPVEGKLIPYYSVNNSAGGQSTVYSLDSSSDQSTLIYSAPGILFGIDSTPSAVIFSIIGQSADQNLIEVIDASGNRMIDIADARLDGFNFVAGGNISPYAPTVTTEQVYFTASSSQVTTGAAILKRIETSTTSVGDVLDGVTGRPYSFDVNYGGLSIFGDTESDIWAAQLNEFLSNGYQGDLLLFDDTKSQVYRATSTMALSEQPFFMISQ